MKKLLMCSAAIALGLAVAAPAKADGIKLDLAGHFKGYVTWMSEDNPAGATVDERHVDILRETEIHFTGETTLDNGLTVGVHHEADIDSEGTETPGTTNGGADTFTTEESYAYFSGSWGRVNFGKEDGANYLLQVAAPSADENYDGLRQYINPFNIGLSQLSNIAVAGHAPIVLASTTVGGRGFLRNGGKLDYADDATGYSNKFTYLTPVWSGLQGGVSYTPATGGNALDTLPVGGNSSTVENSTAFGVHANNVAAEYGDAWEGGLRYEGKFQELGVTLGGGYTRVNLENKSNIVLGANTIARMDDFNQWNLGAALSWQQFGFGVVYTRDNGGVTNDGQDRTWVAGIDYTTGPFKIGGSYTNNHEGLGPTSLSNGVALASDGSLDTQRWAAGVVYTYGPGMTFRGSVGWVRSSLPSEQETVNTVTGNVNSTDVLLGTQINF